MIFITDLTWLTYNHAINVTGRTVLRGRDRIDDDLEISL